MRTIVFGGPYWGPCIFGNYHLQAESGVLLEKDYMKVSIGKENGNWDRV